MSEPRTPLSPRSLNAIEKRIKNGARRIKGLFDSHTGFDEVFDAAWGNTPAYIQTHIEKSLDSYFKPPSDLVERGERATRHIAILRGMSFAAIFCESLRHNPESISKFIDQITGAMDPGIITPLNLFEKPPVFYEPLAQVIPQLRPEYRFAMRTDQEASVESTKRVAFHMSSMGLAELVARQVGLQNTHYLGNRERRSMIAEGAQYSQLYLADNPESIPRELYVHTIVGVRE